MGDVAVLERLLKSIGTGSIEIESRSGTARYPSVQTKLEANLRGWLPIMGVNLSETLIGTVIEEGHHELRDFVTADGQLVFQTRALIDTGRKL